MDVTLSTFDRKEIVNLETTSFECQNMEQTIKLSIVDALVGNILTSEHEIPCIQAITEGYDYMKDVELYDLKESHVGLLIGARFARHYMGKEIREGGEDEPIAILTDFGWCIAGPISDKNSVVEIAQIDTFDGIKTDIERLILRMYRHDFMSRPGEEFPSEMKHPSREDEFSLEQIMGSMSHNAESGHYRCAIPWRHGREKTAEIFNKIDFLGYCRNRHRKLREKLLNNPVLKEGTFKQVQQLVDSGYARVIPNYDAPPGSPVCCMALHVVVKPDKPGKFRVTQDAAAKVKGVSFNQHVLNGPDQLNNLIGILCRFRRKKVVLSADIKDFFYRVELDEKDRPATRFIFWKDPELTIEQYYEGLTHLFGFGSSPTVSNTAVKYHAELTKEQFGMDVYMAILLQMYVDDYLDSLDTVDEARDMKKRMTECLALGGFNLTK